MILSPVFDPTTKTWWVTEPCKCEAPTIRQLKYTLRKLYPTLRFEVPDYYVGDSPRTIWPPDPKPTKAKTVKVEVTLPSRIGRPPRLRSKYISLYDSILDAWALGFTQEKIAGHFSVTKYAVEDIVALGRRRKDARAVYRRGGPPRLSNKEEAA